MNGSSKLALVLVSTVALAVLPGAASARHGADDPADHCRRCDDVAQNADRMQRGRGADDAVRDDRGRDAANNGQREANDANDDRGVDANQVENEPNDVNDDRGVDANDVDVNEPNDVNDDRGRDANDVEEHGGRPRI